MAYVLLIAWIILVSIVCFGFHMDVKKNNDVFLTLVFGYMAFLMGMRGLSVGVDTYHYQELYNIIAGMPFSEIFSSFYHMALELGYVLMMKICAVVGGSYFLFQFVFAVIYSLLSAKFLKDNSENILIATIVFVGIGAYIMAFNIARQMLAVMITVNSWTYLKKKKYYQVLLIILLAASVHITAIIFFFACLLYILRMKKYLLKISPLLLIVAAIKHKEIINFVSLYVKKYASYLSNHTEHIKAGMVWIMWLILIFIAFWVIYLSKNENREHYVIAIFTLIYVVFYIVGLSFNYFERLGLYFMPFVSIMLSFFSAYFKKISTRMIYNAGVCAAYIFYFLLSALRSSQYNYITFLE